MEIHTVEINYTYETGVVIDRPNGSGDNLLVIFKTPAFITFNGETRQVIPNNAVVFAKGTHQLYGLKNGLYINHCIHMDCDEKDEIHTRAGLKFDTVFPLARPEKIEELIREISLGFYSEAETENEVSLLLLRVLIYRLGESCRAYLNGEKNREKNNHEAALQDLRTEIYSNPAKKITVEEMAARLCISVSHFQRIYRNKFGVSSYDDVIRARIKLAEHYLRTTNIEVNKIAELCGYESTAHFMRQFKLKTGCTPSEYRTV